MAIYLEFPKLSRDFPFRCLVNDGSILTTPHWHKEIEIILITKGKVNLGINDRLMQLKENEAVIINGGDVHYVLASPGSERLVFQFELNLFNDTVFVNHTPITLKELFGRIEYFSPSWKPDVQNKIIELLKLIYMEEENKDIGYIYSIKGKLYELVTILFREMTHSNVSYEGKTDVNSKEILEQLALVFQYIERNYTHPIKLEDAAKIIGFSTCYFTKFFKKYTGKTFVTFLNEYRIDKAKWILLNEDILVTELIERVGLGSNKTFYRLFKQLIGVSPLTFKRLAREGK
ncbi:AraC family transcriptional regulator [Peribacillus loiseleuriae]|uniref:AraC family transcriptional regulator n=1 Tax=Peribacillus loiseleuriae TaxID=1679170 RepID=A0A0K9GU28_9BACI|nr:AraC family transcriptional regulator [Peribacillus loiseleuriae]KMY50194.1 AraC family transcriptional regulator [Peribacillus loiseleuriae]